MRYRKSEAKAFGRANLHGIWAAIPYPFTAKGELDEAGLRRDVRKYVDLLKLDGLFFGGLVGEYWSLTMEDRRRGQQIVVEEVGDKAQTLAHTGCMSLRDTIALTQHAQQIGATYVIVSNPAVSTREPDDLYGFFKGLCAEVDIAVSLFNTPICGYSLSPEMVARIAEIENIFCIKNPLPPAHTDEVRRLAGGKIVICDPNEGRWLDNIIKHKDKLFMSSPDPYLLQVAGRQTMHEYTQKAMAGDVAGARAGHVSGHRLLRVLVHGLPPRDLQQVGVGTRHEQLVLVFDDVVEPTPLVGIADDDFPAGQAPHLVGVSGRQRVLDAENIFNLSNARNHFRRERVAAYRRIEERHGNVDLGAKALEESVKVVGFARAHRRIADDDVSRPNLLRVLGKRDGVPQTHAAGVRQGLGLVAYFLDHDLLSAPAIFHRQGPVLADQTAEEEAVELEQVDVFADVPAQARLVEFPLCRERVWDRGPNAVQISPSECLGFGFPITHDFSSFSD